MKWYGGGTFSNTTFYAYQGCANEACGGNQAVYRLSFSLALFFLVISFTSCCFPSIHQNMWGVKLLSLFIGTAGTFFVPNDVFSGYAEVARVVAILFLLLQVLILIDFAFDLNEYMLGKAGMGSDDNVRMDDLENPVCWQRLYALLGIGMVVVAVACTGVIYQYYGGCDFNLGMTTITLIVGVVGVICSLHGRIGRGLLPPAFVFMYNVYMLWTALSNNPEKTCNPSYSDTTSQGAGSVVIGLALASFSLTWTTFSASRSAGGLFSRDPEDEEETLQVVVKEPVTAGGEIIDGDAETGKGKDTATVVDEEDGAVQTAKPAKNQWFFHFIMAMGSFYMAMLLTNWGNSDTTGMSTYNTEISVESMWVKLASQWLSFLLFFWVLFAPVIFPGRNFQDTNNSLA